MTLLRILLVSLLFTTTAALATDKTDLYYIPSESGWGMTIANQGDTIFVTVYVYGADRAPTWFVGTGFLQSTDSQGVNTYGGDWFSVTGPYYGAATFDSSTVGATKVGTFTYRELSVTTGQINYTVGSTASVTKTVQRQTLALSPRVNGTYGGAYFSTVAGCPTASDNGNVATFMTLTATGTPAATTFTLQLLGGGVACTATGPWTQSGRMGAITGTWSCNNGLSGNASIFEIESGTNTMSARIRNTFSGCTETGYFSAARLGS